MRVLSIVYTEKTFTGFVDGMLQPDCMSPSNIPSLLSLPVLVPPTHNTNRPTFQIGIIVSQNMKVADIKKNRHKLIINARLIVM